MPKGFSGHFGLIQRNAILSWTRLEPRPEILLLGDDPGVGEFAAEHGLKHLPVIAKSPKGRPLISDIFLQADRHSTAPVLCYINADIVLLSDFLPAVARVQSRFKKFLAAGRRTDTDITTPIDFDDADWEPKLRQVAITTGFLQAFGAIDYFIHTRGLFGTIPPFLIGRTSWDNWLLYRARERGAPIIDMTAVVTVIHQNHDYSTVPGGRATAFHGDEAAYNRALCGGNEHFFTLYDATHRLMPGGLRWATDRWRAYLARVPVFYPHLRTPARWATQTLEGASWLWQRWRRRDMAASGESS
ncbi:MAG TPA: hypothetical protein PKD86_11850, partial [Gemmatales bacterium]|nr:hypothetical protein [Gemmatales bacterium]HMP60037.1 hypothetical protein [Gemmatales bacterium]